MQSKKKPPQKRLAKKVVVKKEPKKWRGEIFVEGHVDYFEIYIFSEFKDMFKATQNWYSKEYKQTNGDNSLDFNAMFISSDKLAPIENNRRCCGAMFFYTKKFTHGIIAHELTHAVTYYERSVMGYKGAYDDYITSTFCPEERLAYTMQSLTEQVYSFCKINKISIAINDEDNED